MKPKQPMLSSEGHKAISRAIADAIISERRKRRAEIERLQKQVDDLERRLAQFEMPARAAGPRLISTG